MRHSESLSLTLHNALISIREELSCSFIKQTMCLCERGCIVSNKAVLKKGLEKFNFVDTDCEKSRNIFIWGEPISFICSPFFKQYFLFLTRFFSQRFHSLSQIIWVSPQILLLANQLTSFFRFLLYFAIVLFRFLHRAGW